MKTQINTVIVDDSLTSINILTKDLSKYTQFKVIGKFNFPNEAIDFIRSTQPDVLFLDIEMPGMSGLELLAHITPFIHKDMAVVFYSAHNQYLFDAIRKSAFDFLLKPYEKDTLDLIICRILTKLRDGSTRFLDSLHFLQKYDTRFTIYTKNGEMIVNDMEVVYFESGNGLSRRWKMIMVNLESYDLRNNTTSDDILKTASSFVRVNKQHIININYLAGIEKGRKRCLLFYPPFNEIKHICLSNEYYDDVMDRFTEL